MIHIHKICLFRTKEKLNSMQKNLIGKYQKNPDTEGQYGSISFWYSSFEFFNLFDLFGENVSGKEQDKKCWIGIKKMSLVLHRKG